MRHHNPTSVSHWNRCYGKILYKPYETQYIDSYKSNGFKYASLKKRYVKILRYIADHDGCKRVDIIRDVYGYKNVNAKDKWYPNSRICRGQGSTVFSQLLYIDVIDYDAKFCYHITDRGREVLKTAYLNDCAKFVKEYNMNK